MPSDDDRVDVRSGDSDMVTFEVLGRPDPPFVVRQVTPDPEIRYRYRWEDRGYPAPEEFERVSHLEVKLVGMMTDLDGDLEEEAAAVHDALVELREAMMDARGLEDEQRQEVAMGNLEALPEVTDRVVLRDGEVIDRG